MVFYAIEAVQKLTDLPPALVIGHGAEAVQQAIFNAGSKCSLPAGTAIGHCSCGRLHPITFGGKLNECW